MIVGLNPMGNLNELIAKEGCFFHIENAHHKGFKVNTLKPSGKLYVPLYFWRVGLSNYQSVCVSPTNNF
jgi:hypothetical protein